MGGVRDPGAVSSNPLQPPSANRGAEEVTGICLLQLGYGRHVNSARSHAAGRCRSMPEVRSPPGAALRSPREGEAVGSSLG